MEIVSLFIPVIVVCAFIFWLAELIDLMERGDEDFPGRNDKVAWVIVVIFLPLLGALLFWRMKRRAKR